MLDKVKKEPKVLSPLEEILCERLKSARLATFPQLSQKDVGTELGVTAGAISMWETGRTSPGPDHLLRLAQLYSVSIDWLFGYISPNALRQTINNEFPAVPLIDNAALAEWDFSKPLGKIQTSQEYPRDTCAAIEVDFTSPLPELVQKGDVLIVLRGNTMKEGVFMVKEENSKFPVLRRGVVDGGRMMFFADDPRYPALERSKVGIVGRVLEVIRRTQLG